MNHLLLTYFAANPCLLPYLVYVKSPPIIGDFDDHLASLLTGRDHDMPHLIFLYRPPVLGSFQAVIQGVADNMSQRIGQHFDDGPVYFCLLAVNFQVNLLAQLTG
ncbi:hypothetical protein ES708_32060 [subsurface metagenome]